MQKQKQRGGIEWQSGRTCYSILTVLEIVTNECDERSFI